MQLLSHSVWSSLEMNTNVNCMLGLNIEGVVKRHFSYSACGTPSYV